MRAELQLTADDIRTAIQEYIIKRTGVFVAPTSITMQTKSKQNFRSEWEEADFRAHFTALSLEKAKDNDQ